MLKSELQFLKTTKKKPTPREKKLVFGVEAHAKGVIAEGGACWSGWAAMLANYTFEDVSDVIGMAQTEKTALNRARRVAYALYKEQKKAAEQLKAK